MTAIKQTIPRESIHSPKNGELTSLAEAFYEYQLAASTGPQLEGVIREDALRVIEDSHTIWAELDGGTTAHIPTAFPLGCDSLAHRAFYERRGGVDGVYMLSSTVKLLDFMALQELADQLQQDESVQSLVLLQQSGGADAPIEEENVNTLIAALTMNRVMDEQPMIDSTTQTPTGIIHFTGLPEFNVELNPRGLSLHQTFQEMLENGEVERLPDTGTTILTPDVLSEELAERIWEIYDKQLDILVEDHPAYQRLDRELIMDMLKCPSNINIVHFVEGEPVCIFLGVTDLSTCEWINGDHISGRYEEEVLYCPALVTDFDKQGHNYASNIFKLLTRMAIVRGENIRPYFECTDISAGYIPGILEKAIKDTGLATIKVEKQEEYRYRRLVRN